MLYGYLQDRHLILEFIKRDLRLRYMGSLLGKYWNIVNPLVMIVIYTIVFSRVMEIKTSNSSNQFSYTGYLCSGLLPWIAFSETICRGSTVFIEHGHLIKKISFPFPVLPMAVAGSTATTFLVSWIGFMTAMPFLGMQYTSYLWCVPLIFFVQIVFSLGICLTVSVLNTFLRDVQQITNILIQLWFWLTPIVYLEDQIPSKLKWIILANPFAYFVNMYHQVVVFSQLPELKDMIISVLVATLSFAIGSMILKKFHEQIPDEV